MERCPNVGRMSGRLFSRWDSIQETLGCPVLGGYIVEPRNIEGRPYTVLGSTINPYPARPGNVWF